MNIAYNVKPCQTLMKTQQSQTTNNGSTGMVEYDYSSLAICHV